MRRDEDKMAGWNDLQRSFRASYEELEKIEGALLEAVRHPKEKNSNERTRSRFVWKSYVNSRSRVYEKTRNEKFLPSGNFEEERIEEDYCIHFGLPEVDPTQSSTGMRINCQVYIGSSNEQRVRDLLRIFHENLPKTPERLN